MQKFYKKAFFVILLLFVLTWVYIIYLKIQSAGEILLTQAEAISLTTSKERAQNLYRQSLKRLDSIFTINEMIKTGYGECKTSTSFTNSIPNNYLQVQVAIIGNSVKVEKFTIDHLDYSSKPGCFISNPNGNNTMNNFIPFNSPDSIILFSLNIRTRGILNNPFEFSITLKDNKGSTLAKFPKEGDSFKGRIQFLKYPVIISDTINLKKLKLPV